MTIDLNAELGNKKIGWRNKAQQQRAEQRDRLAAISPNDDPERIRVATREANQIGIEAERNERRAAAAEKGLLWVDIVDLAWSMDPQNQPMLWRAKAEGRVEEFGGDGSFITGQLKRGQGEVNPAFETPELTGMTEDELAAWTV